MKLTNLKPLYKIIKENNETYTTFEFKKNNLVFEIFFDIDSIPFQLGFIVKHSNFEMWVEVMPGFEISPIIDKTDYKKLVGLLGLIYDPNNKFSTLGFFEEFNLKIPAYGKKNKELAVYVGKSKYQIEYPDKIYFLKMMPWTSQHRSFKNTEKTRLLLPKLYERIKNNPHISVGYTNVENDNIINELKKCVAHELHTGSGKEAKNNDNQ